MSYLTPSTVIVQRESIVGIVMAVVTIGAVVVTILTVVGSFLLPLNAKTIDDTTIKLKSDIKKSVLIIFII